MNRSAKQFSPVLKASLLVVLVVLPACSRSPQSVRTVQAALAVLHSSVHTNGKVEAENVFELHAPYAAVCRRIVASEGSKMKAGEEILVLDDSALRSELTAAKAELEAAEVDLRDVRRGPRKEEIGSVEAEIARYRLELEDAEKILATNRWLLEKDAVSRFDVEQSQNRVAVAKQSLDAATNRLEDLKHRYGETDYQRATARVDAAKAQIGLLEWNLRQSVIRAPSEGTLYQFGIKEGAYLNAGDMIGLFADLSRLRIRSFVDEPDLGRVSVGADVVIQWNARPDRTWKGKVEMIPPQIVLLGTRAVAEVLCSLTGPQDLLVPNVNVDVEIAAGQGPQVISLPRAAVVPEGQDQYVWLMREGKALKRQVETGRSTSDLIEITSGVASGDRVIIPGEAKISEGMRVGTGEQ
jgi:multidrug efflux pump subunit AcrA (membrane-fusion protein)